MAYSPYSFGPPDIFQTQANMYQDSFANPMNAANMNPGWGINSSLLTPSFDAPYRPQYGGSQPYNQFGRVGFFGGMNRLYNPFVREPVWGNPVDHQQGSIEGMSSRPFDAGMWGAQRIAAPALAFGAAYRALGPRSFGGYFTGSGIAAGMGQALGRGFGMGLGMGEMGAGIMGVAGSLTGAVVLPWALATGAMAGAQRSIFNPYINSRQESMDLRRNFAGVSFGDATGNVVTGGGLGYGESTRMAQGITRAGIQDMSFSTSQYSNIADMSARAGLMDNVQSKQITQRVKDIAEQIKMIMSISSDPSFKNAIEELAKLNMAGASMTGGQFSTAAQTYRGLGNFAAQAGTSVQRLMNTVGAQGQYLFQSNGMTPYLGQMAAANTYAGFAAAQRVGLMTPAQLARMGGIEGASQAALTGTVAAAQTPYNMMSLYNQTFGGGGSSSMNGRNMNVIDVTRSFGASMSQDPIGTMGRMELYGDQMTGNQIAGQGAHLAENQALSIMRMMPTIKKNANGQYDASSLMFTLTHTMGLSHEQAMATINSLSNDYDPKVASQRAKGADRFAAEQMRQVISQDSLYGGPLSVVRLAKQAGRDVVQGVSDAVVNPVLDALGWTGDTIQSVTDKAIFGSTISGGMKVSDLSTLFNKSSKTLDPLKLIDTNRAARRSAPSISIAHARVGSKINDLAKQGDSDARAFLEATDDSTKRKAFTRLLSKNADVFGSEGQDILNNDNGHNFETAYKEIKARQTISYIPTTDVASDRLTKALQNTEVAPDRVGSQEYTPEGMAFTIYHDKANSAKFGLADDLNAAGAAYDLVKQMQGPDAKVSASNIDDIMKDPKYASLRKITSGKTGGDLVNAVNGVFQRGAQQGTLGIGSNTFRKGATLDSYIQSNGSQIKDNALRKEFQDAKARGDTTGMNQAFVKSQVGPDGQVLDAGMKNATSLPASEVLKAVQATVESDTQKGKLYDVLKSGQIDFSTYQSTVNTLDQKETIEKFANSVTEFGGYVKKANGDSSDSGSGGDSGSRWYNPTTWFGSDTSKQTGPTGANT